METFAAQIITFLKCRKLNIIRYK